jgi:hypothetical protein
VNSWFTPGPAVRPRQDSNLGTRFRKPMLYPLSYGGTGQRRLERKVREAFAALAARSAWVSAAAVVRTQGL